MELIKKLMDNTLGGSISLHSMVKKRAALFKQVGTAWKMGHLRHSSLVATAKLHELRFEVLNHPPYSLDLAPSDFFLFLDLKEPSRKKKISI